MGAGWRSRAPRALREHRGQPTGRGDDCNGRLGVRRCREGALSPLVSCSEVCVFFNAPNSIPKVCAWAQGLMMVEHGPDRTVTVLSTRVSNSSTLDPDTVRKPIC